MNEKTMQYFISMWPILMSLWLGGSIVGSLYGTIAYTKKKILEKWICTIEFNDNDPVFQWMQKYIKDNKLIDQKGTLKCYKKPPEDRDEGHQSFLDRSNDKRKPQVTFDTGCG